MKAGPISSQTIHGGIVLFMLAAVAASEPGIIWPWHLLLPLASYFIWVLILPGLRRSIPKINLGRCDFWTCAVVFYFSLACSGVLLAFQMLFHPDISRLAASMPMAWFDSLFLAGLCFSLGNAILEELIFRWSFYEAFAAEWGDGLAILFTAIMFGLGHIEGYPPGWLGAVLAGGYGACLGLLRWWTGGLALCVGCHVCADATIFMIAIGNR